MCRALPLRLSLVVALIGAASAWGHGAPTDEGLRSTVSGVEPLVPGLTVTVLESGTLTVRNWSGRTVVVDGPDGRPLYRFDDTGVHRRAGNSWRLLEQGTSYAWHDPRVHWTGPVPDRSGLVGRFSIPGRADGEPFVVSGYIGYQAPASAGSGFPLPAWALALAAVVGALLLAALALPLLARREGEDASDEAEAATEAASGTQPRRT